MNMRTILFGWGFLLILMLLFSRVRVGWRHVKQLLLAGIPMISTSILYGYAVEQLPASLAVLLLFQFTWIGVILEAVMQRRFPSKGKLVSLVVLIAGTLLAGGVLEQSSGGWTLSGVIFGLLSAVSFALYIYLSGNIATDVPVLSRTFVMVSSALVLAMIFFTPSILFDGSIVNGLWKYGIPLGLLGIIVPVIFFAIAIPKVGSGLGTILSAAELPAAVIVSVTVLREHVSILQWIGIAVVLVGIAIPQMVSLLSKSHMKPADS
ncbi:DMT family transporter [Paenibacillus woosongensis]|uniref:DMT family transporter n=1 Tax=Paenibacillus woosongensis TaxID=307580 RepID=A0AA95I7M0_9BACL|nr:DMT family transporter [Paenibacillus woosongensis]WHX50701.1 DMT family transporter [Paenibacillus woosongensis]